MGRYWTWMCHPAVQPLAARGTMNHGVFDFFSVVHTLIGLAFGALGVGLVPVLILAVGWELAEHVFKNACPIAFIHPSQDTLLNSASDVLVAAIGWCCGRAIRTTGRADVAG